ncbi:MAG: hypothetical protein GX430_03155 [Treponema sp.]|nr:hypothetical protein [Treponema sp.]
MMDESDRGVEALSFVEDSIVPNTAGRYEFPADLGAASGRPRAETTTPSVRARRLKVYLSRLDH